MPGHRRPKRKGAAVSRKATGALQPTGKPKPKAKAKPEIVPAKRIVGVGTAKATVIESSLVTRQSLAIGNGGAIIKVTEQQAAAVRKLGDSL